MIDFQRIGAFGRSKSGKSTLMDRIMAQVSRSVLFDAIEERRPNALKQGYTEVTDINELQYAIADSYQDGFKFWYRPETDTDYMIQALSDLSELLLDLQTQFTNEYGIENRRAITLGVDEMADCYPNHTLKKGQDKFANMCRMGRHKGIHLIGASQRPAEVSTKFRGQLEKRYFFSLQEPRDLDAVADMGGAQGRQLAEAVRLLKPLEFIRMVDGKYSSGKLVFEPAVKR